MINNDDYEAAVDEINAILQKYDYSAITRIAEHVANVCNVDVADLFSSLDKASIAQSRWLLWYAYRYATGETYDVIAKRSYSNGHVFCARAVACGISKMSALIDKQNNIWYSRWMVIKAIIKNDMKTQCKKKINMTLHIPKNLGNVDVIIKKD